MRAVREGDRKSAEPHWDTRGAVLPVLFPPNPVPGWPRRPEHPLAPASAPGRGVCRLTSNRRTSPAAAAGPALAPPLARLPPPQERRGGASRLSWRHTAFVLRVVPKRSHGGTADLRAEANLRPLAVAARAAAASEGGGALQKL